MKAIALAILLISATQILALSPVEKAVLNGATLDSALLWGTYKSMLLHAVSQVTEVHNPVSFSMLLMPDSVTKDFSNIKYKVKDIQTSTNLKTYVDYEMHDGFSFGHQKILDPSANINMTNSFVKTAYSSMTNQSWLDLTRIFSESKSTDSIALEEYTNVFFAVTLESFYNNETSYLDFDPKTNRIIVNKAGGVKEYFRYSLFKNGSLDNTIVPYFKVYSGMNRTSNWAIANWTYKALELDESGEFLILPSDISELNNDSSLVILQFRLPVGTSFDILFEYSSTGLPHAAPSLATVLNTVEKAKSTWLNVVQNTFTVGSLGKNESGLLKSCISNLLGGITYAYGPIRLKETKEPQPNLGLFSATPARNSFPHAFLWDEGFHDLLVCRWSPQLCMYIMRSWFNTQRSDGWIPREQARGPESEDTIPGAFVEQSIYEGNPPTFLLSILWLLENVDDSEGVTQFIKDVYPNLALWFSWFYESQGYHSIFGQHQNFFIWYGKLFTHGLQFFGSGLDDYPRNDPGRDSLYSLDLHVWEIVFAQCMKAVAGRLGKEGESLYYGKVENLITGNLKYFLDSKDNLYKDVFRMAYFDNPDRAEWLQKIVQYFEGFFQFPSSHVGYVSFWPLMFGLIPNNSKELDALLDLIDTNGVEIAPWGILSLNRNDSMYEKNDNYWTSPVWINCNYMILKGIKRYYSTNERAMRIYNSVREGLIRNVVDKWVTTGYIWENYNSRTGDGQGNHPFTGWSTLMALVMSEDY